MVRRMRWFTLFHIFILPIAVGTAGCTSAPSEASGETPLELGRRAGQADLVVTRIGATAEPVRAGEAVRLNATIKNVGSKSTPSRVTHGVLFVVAQHDKWTTFSGNFSGPLAPGAERELVASDGGDSGADGSWTPPARSYDITAMVDDVNRIAESAENNNARPFSLAVGSGSPAGCPYAGTNGFYVDSESEPARWLRGHGGDPRAPTIRARIVQQPMARWVGPGDISGWVGQYVTGAAQAGKLPVLVAYAIPNRDCGGHSAGGERNTKSYIAWARRLAQAIGERHAIVILEPDATMICWNQRKATQLRGAIDALNQHAPKTWVYLDAGDSRWNPPREGGNSIFKSPFS